MDRPAEPLRPFRGVSKGYLGQYVAVFEWSHNLKTATTDDFLRALLGVGIPFLAISPDDPSPLATAFHPTPSQSVDARFMREESTVHYTETDSLQLVEIPYADGKFSMTVVLPKAGYDLASISSSLAPDALNALLASAAPRDTIVTLPEFHLSQSFELTNALSAMGMPALFNGSADLSGIDGAHDLSVGGVVHQTFLNVTPAGTEAAAATGGIVRVTAVFEPAPPPPAVVTADHPFYFAIRNTQTDATLFSGTLIHPDAAT